MSEKEAIKNENREMNTMKALGIIAVVLGHTAFPYMKILYSYHMALFFFVAGYFFKDKYIEHPYEFIKRRIKSYYIPFLIYSVIFLFLRNVFVNMHLLDETMRINYINIPYYIRNIIFFSLDDPLLGTFWFFVVILYVSIIFLVINIILEKFQKRNFINLTFIIALIYALAFLLWQKGIDITKYINHNNKSILRVVQYFFDYKTLIMLGIYYTGYLYKNFESKITIDIRYVIILIFIMLFYFRDGIYIDTSANMFNNPIYFYCGALMGIYVNLYISKLLCRFNIKLLDEIGKKSMYIMIFHFLAFKIVNYVEIKIYNLPIDKLASYPTLIMNWGDKWWIVFSLAGIFIPMILEIIIRNFKNLFIGKRKVIKNE